MYSLKDYNPMNNHVFTLGKRTSGVHYESLLNHNFLFPLQKLPLSSMLIIPLCFFIILPPLYVYILFNFEQINHKNKTGSVGKLNIATVRARFPGED